jgi:hypothetical protein
MERDAEVAQRGRSLAPCGVNYRPLECTKIGLHGIALHGEGSFSGPLLFRVRAERRAASGWPVFLECLLPVVTPLTANLWLSSARVNGGLLWLSL